MWSTNDVQLRHAILGLLSIEPQSGYDLGRAFARSVGHFWHADQSQIYRTLDQMDSQGIITTETIVQSGRPDRRVHSLTSIGRDELDAWLRSAQEEERPKEPFLARLFFAGSLGVDGVTRLLAERECVVAATLERLRSISEPEGDLDAELRAATLRSGITAAEAELAWLADTRRRVAAYETGA